MKEVLEILEEVIIRLEDMNVSGDNWGQTMIDKITKQRESNNPE